MVWETVKEWEERTKKPYPTWAAVWSYDAYGERWESRMWKEVREFYEVERTKERGVAAWDIQMEPMVCNPELDYPKWGDGKVLIRSKEGVIDES